MRFLSLKQLSLSIIACIALLSPIHAQAQFRGRKVTKADVGISADPKIQKVEKSRTLRLPTKTDVKVWNGQNEPGKENFLCLDEVFVSNKREELNWWIQWETQQGGVSRALYQVSLFPFSAALDWNEVPGLLDSGAVQYKGKKGLQPHFQINLGSLLSGGSAAAEPEARAKISYRGSRNIRKDLRVQQNPASGNIDRMRLAQDGRPAVPYVTFYIRIVTLDAGNIMAGAPSDAAILRWGEPSVSNVNWFGDPNAFQQPPEIHSPKFRIVEYRPFHDYMPDWPYRFVVTRDTNLLTTTYKKGTRLYLPPKPDGDDAWEAVKDAVNSIVDSIEDAVNRVSSAYQDVKQRTLDYAIQAIPGCSSSDVCASGLSFAMDYGLAGIGIPPTVPNFDDLKSMGRDYLVQYAAEQSKLPVGEAIKVVDRFMDEADNAAAAGSWLKLDTSQQYSDALLIVEASNPTGKATDPSVIAVRQFERLFLFPNGGKLMTVPVPSIPPGKTIRVPIVMQPNSMQYTPGASMLQSEWNKLADKGVLLSVYGDQIRVHNEAIVR